MIRRLITAAALCVATAASAQTFGVHVATNRAASPGAYAITEDGVTAGMLFPGLRAADAVAYAGTGLDVLDLGLMRFGVEVGASLQCGRVGVYVVVSMRAGPVRLMWSPASKAAGLSLEFWP